MHARAIVLDANFHAAPALRLFVHGREYRRFGATRR
jgi:hypothetical protein